MTYTLLYIDNVMYKLIVKYYINFHVSSYSKYKHIQSIHDHTDVYLKN